MNHRRIRPRASQLALIVSLALLVGSVLYAFVQISVNQSNEARSLQILNDRGLGNRQAFCNTERLLLVRAIQNGYKVPANAAVDVCNIPIIGTPPLPPEGTPLPITAPIPHLTPSPTRRPTTAPTPTSAPTNPPPTAQPVPNITPTPGPICIVNICL